MTSQGNPKDDTQTRVKKIFGSPKKVVSGLVQTSVAIQSLPPDLQGKLITALDKLPEEKQVLAVQALQKEQGAYIALSRQEFARGKEALVKLKRLKDTYKQKKRQLVEKYERKAAETHTSSLLNS